MFKAKTRSVRGDTLYILFTALVILFILIMSLSYVYQQQVTQIGRHGYRTQAYYLALSALDRTVNRFKQLMDGPLVKTVQVRGKDEFELDEQCLGLLDPERAKDWARSYEYVEGEIMDGGSAKVVAQLLDVAKNEFFCFIDRVEKIPPGLESYREKRDEEDNPIPGAAPLGGWSGRLKLTATATYRGLRCVVETVRDVKVIDISPPAPDHTLFVHGKKTEYIRAGTFVLSNLTLPKQVTDLIHDLTLKINQVLKIPEISENKADVLRNVEYITKKLVTAEAEADSGESMKLIYDLTQHVGQAGGDEKIKDMVDNIILSLNPRDWGRVRTNGVLQVYLPFFAPDDIINYFADSSIFGHQRPEIGYHNHYNRLHDPYLSVYTHYEGYIYKNYRRLNPMVLGPSKEPQVVPPQRYTINTRMNYVLRYPEREEVPNLKRLEKFAPKYATMVHQKPLFLFGTKKNPIKLGGIWYCKDSVRIGGHYQGRGLVISEKEIIVTESLRHTSQKAEQDMLAIVALQGPVKLAAPSGQVIIEGGIYAKDGVKGNKRGGLKLLGNLSCENLNRDEMPRIFECRFNPRLKNHMVDNLLASVSERLLSFRVLGDRKSNMDAAAGHANADEESHLKPPPSAVERPPEKEAEKDDKKAESKRDESKRE